MRRCTLLNPYRVLDLTDEKGYYCGKIMADLGCDVVKIERPGGDPARNIGPFYKDVPDSERSLSWFAFNSNKRSITVDVETADGRNILTRLVESADFLVESFAPGYLESLGLGYRRLREINPRIIVVSITPFGQTGPYRDYQASDIVCMALSGYMYMCGDPDRAPVRISAAQAFLHASADAVVGSLIALHHREETGSGQHVDVSAQESLTFLLMGAHIVWMDDGRIWSHRQGPYHYNPDMGTRRHQTWPCKDGAVGMQLWGGAIGAAMFRALVEWMDREGMANEFLKSMDWDAFDIRTATQELLDRVQGPIAEFFLTHTKAELYSVALERRILLAPVSDAKELTGNPQLQSRAFWTSVEHSELDDIITYPGLFYRSSTVAAKVPRRAPRIGEHNEDILAIELGFTAAELGVLKRGRVI